MGIIRELPPAVINQIAAGEVVERPASVVKELLENAVDAGASRVELTVERGGKDLVRVADDGKGMDRDDLLLAFRPHATSKLAAVDDLAHIQTLGFRGEALAAIAEISRVRCQSRTNTAETGSELQIEGGEQRPVRDCGSPPGTVIEVRNLFFNTPVRRTFLKSDTTEAGHVSEMFIRIALAHPSVQFTYKSGSRTVHDLPATSGIKERITTFFGPELAESLIWVESRIEPVHLWGYVAHPSQSRSSAKGQYLFVCGRYVRDRSLAHALGEAYRGLLMTGRQPVAFLYLELPPEEVDVNAHPTKIEVRFRDSQRIYGQMLSTVRQTFLGSDLHARLSAPEQAETKIGEPLPTEAPYEMPTRPVERQELASWFQPSVPRPAAGIPPNAPPAGTIGVPREPAWAKSLPPAPAPRPFDEIDPDEPVITPVRTTASAPQTVTRPLSPEREPEHPLPASSVSSESVLPESIGEGKALQLHDSYLIAETEEGMVVIDQHALHERILYEEMRSRLAAGGVEAQRLLVPEPVDLSPADCAEVLQRREALAQLGFEVEAFGGDTVLILTIPVMLQDRRPDQLLRDLAEQFRSRPLPPTPDAMLEDVLSTMACKAAVKAGQPLAPEEIAALLARRHLVSNTHHCPHGRPTALTFTRTELERQFGRI